MKKFLCLIALLFASVGLVGCVVPGVTPGGATGKTTITFWHAMGQSNQVIIQEMIDSFEKAYPMFEVEQYSQGGYTDLRDKILNSIPVGEAPTIAQAYPDHIANYLNAKAAQELDSYIDDTKAFLFASENKNSNDEVKRFSMRKNHSHKAVLIGSPKSSILIQLGGKDDLTINKYERIILWI